MAVKLNDAGRSYARSLIAAGKVDKTSAWSFTAEDGDALLGSGGDDWGAYGQAHLGVDTAAADKTKARFAYPFAKGGTLYRSALVAIRDRAAQHKADDIFDAAGAMLHEIGAGKDDEDEAAKASTLIRPSPFQALFAELFLLSGSRILAIDEGRALHQAREAEAREPSQVAILPMMGPVYTRGRSSFAGTSFEAFRAQLAQAVANPDVGAIVLDVDSPGGSYAGAPETAAAVRAAAQVKPVTAMVDGLGCSAAYFAISGATQIVVSPSADIGAIGTMAIHQDVSDAYRQMGVKTTIIRDPPTKGEGNPFEPLSDEGLAYRQADVSRATGEFHQGVAQGRRVSVTKVREDFGRGRTVGAQKAVDLGMADRVGTMADVLGGLRTARGGFRRRSAITFA